MNATLISVNTTNNYKFELEFEGGKYDVILYTDVKGKFIDEQITRLQEGYLPHDLGYEGEDGEIREKIVDYLDEKLGYSSETITITIMKKTFVLNKFGDGMDMYYGEHLTFDERDNFALCAKLMHQLFPRLIDAKRITVTIASKRQRRKGEFSVEVLPKKCMMFPVFCFGGKLIKF